jgi:adenylyltransferase/sulfurtransferase
MRQIGVRDLKARLDRGEPTLLVDVRQPWEHELVALPGSLLLPLDQLAERADEIDATAGTLVVTYCHHGIRSLNAVAMLAQAGIEAASLAGGIDRWSLEIDPALARY